MSPHRSGLPLSVQDCITARRCTALETDVGEDRTKLKEWMERKKAERLKLYRSELTKIRETEKHPYQSNESTSKVGHHNHYNVMMIFCHCFVTI